MTLSQWMVAPGQQQHLDEAGVHGAAFDLIHRALDALWRDDARGTQARLAVQPFLDDPVVHRLCKSRGQVLAEKRLDPIKAVHDRDARAEMVERVGYQAAEVGGRLAGLGPPVGTA